MKEPQSFEFTTSISSDDGLPFVIEVHFHDESDIWISHNKKPLKWTYLPDDDQTRIKEEPNNGSAEL